MLLARGVSDERRGCNRHTPGAVRSSPYNRHPMAPACAAELVLVGLT